MTHDPNQLGQTQYGSHSDYDNSSDNASYLPQVKLFTATSKPCQRGQLPPGHYGIQVKKDTVLPLGAAVDFLAYGRTMLAIDFSVPGSVLRTFDTNSDLFKDIKEKAKASDSKRQWGTRFLVFERSQGRFLELFLGTKSSRSEADLIGDYLPLSQADIDARIAAGEEMDGVKPHWALPFTLTADFIEKPSMSWHAPKSGPCNVPFANEPTIEVIREQLDKFLEPPKAPRMVAASAQRAR